MFLFRNKVVAAFLPNEKLATECNTVTCEPTNLEWLFKASPAFPIDASKVFFYFILTDSSFIAIFFLGNCDSHSFRILFGTFKENQIIKKENFTSVIVPGNWKIRKSIG